jgi:putative membrane protein
MQLDVAQVSLCEEVAMMHDWGFGWGWGNGMFFGPLFMIAVPMVVIILLAVLIRWFVGDRTIPRERIHTAREILDERFAKGGIQRDEYEERRKALEA